MRALRQRAGYSQDDLADEIQVHHSYVSRLERGACNPTLATIEKVARGLNVSLVEFFRAVERRQ